jgi:hypothetical protein
VIGAIVLTYAWVLLIVFTAGLRQLLMAVAFTLANRRARLVPQWTTVLTGLLALVGVGSVFAAWIGFMLLPLWAVVMGACLLLTRAGAEPVAA